MKSLAFGLAALAAAFLLQPAGGGDDPLATLDRNIQTQQQQLQQAEADRRRLQEQEAKNLTEQRDLTTYLATLAKNIEAVEEKVATLQRKLEQVGADKGQVEARLKRENEQLAARQGLLARRLREIFKRGGSNAYWQAIFSARDFSDLVNRVRFLRLVMASDAEQIRSLRAEKARVEATRRDLETQQRQIAALKGEQDREQANLAQARARRQAALQVLRTNAELIKKKIAELNAAAEQMKKKLADIQQVRRETAAELARNRTAFANGMGTFPWPLRNVRTNEIVGQFGAHPHPVYHVQVKNNGMDILHPAGSDVLAIRDGTVAFADNFQGYGKTIIIDHGGNFMTIYSYLSAISVAINARVSAGQAIGKVGTSGPEDRPMLHFELHRDDQPQDPLRWLRRL